MMTCFAVSSCACYSAVNCLYQRTIHSDGEHARYAQLAYLQSMTIT
jgi:hypothetical protein